MPRLLKNKTKETGYGWKYPVPETRYIVTGETFDDLVFNTKVHYRLNELDYPKDLCIRIDAHIAENVHKDLTVEKKDEY